MYRKHHAIAAFIVTVILYVIILYVNLGIEFPNPVSAALFGGIVGGILCDWDLIFLKEGEHRHGVFHSSLIAIIIFTGYLFDSMYLGLSFQWMFLYVGMGIHLLLDLLPTTIPTEYNQSFWKRWQYRWMRFSQGKVGGKIITPFGITTNRRRRYWLIINAFICFALAIATYWILKTGFVIVRPW